METPPFFRPLRVTGLFQFNIVFGILVAFVSNYIIGNSFGEARAVSSLQILKKIMFVNRCIPKGWGLLATLFGCIHTPPLSP